MSSLGDGTTVVDGHVSTVVSGNGKARFEEPFKPSATKASAANFVSALDYMEEDRQFFVKIEKDGLIAALQKLDRQLKNVRLAPAPYSLPCGVHRLTFPYVTGWAWTHPVAQGLFTCSISGWRRTDRHWGLQKPTDWIGKEVTPGQIGLINHGGLPKVLTRPGRYPGMPLRNWWARKWVGTLGRAYLASRQPNTAR